ncbi:hypothetical protein [Arthrobacter sp. OY3WO11]|uniref:hypothetical protein n=1 Tax=Arthrobacter sp. OY3WO11 TaxID=1835723 RepID=UPI0007CFFBCB|nr:hypothetical protein [Arthrobacter sp. OY3WO11]OAE02719.1 hypothetical protein A6A22_15725 [Arthrobacter sp. OY3WO11]
MADKTVTSRGGNVGSVLVNAAMMWGINVWPGWQVVPFLTSDMTRVLGIVNASLTAGIVANLVFVVIRNRGVMALGNLVVLGIGLAATLRLWEVFPFDFGESWSGWPVVVRVLLVLGIVGSIIGAVVEIVALFRSLAGLERRTLQ